MAVESSRILDLLADAVSSYRREGEQGIAWTFHHAMTADERLAFDVFLVRMGDELAWQAGTTESRFRERVRRMAVLADTGQLTREPLTVDFENPGRTDRGRRI